MSSNNELLRKADLAIADLSSNGGLLEAEQAATFIRKLITQPTILRDVRTVEMISPTRKINKIQFGKRILRKAVSGTALALAAIEGVFDPVAEATARAKVTTEQITLTSKEVIADVRLPYDVLEDNIERAMAAGNEPTNTGPGGLRDTILDLMIERAAVDLEELGLKGDTTLDATDDYLDLTDGWLKTIKDGGNTVDHGAATIEKTLFKNGLQTLPPQYHRNLASMRHYVSVNNEVEYRDTLANRATALGDANIQGTNTVFGYGVPISSVQLMPEAEGLFTFPLNLLFGIQRAISLEFDKDITTRTYIMVLTARIDFQVEENEAGVHYDNIG